MYEGRGMMNDVQIIISLYEVKVIVMVKVVLFTIQEDDTI